MPLWRCPHCGTPQAETSRCWVCRRSTTSCSTCRHFRRGVAGGLGLCGLDPRRVALRGDELRACWAAPPPAAVEPPRSLVRAVAHGRTFVPVDEPAPVPAATGAERGWSLWGDTEA